MAKRYSQMKALKDRLAKLSPAVASLPFPKKTWSSGIDEATVAARTAGQRLLLGMPRPRARLRGERDHSVGLPLFLYLATVAEPQNIGAPGLL